MKRIEITFPPPWMTISVPDQKSSRHLNLLPSHSLLLKYKDALRYKQQPSLYLGIRYYNGRTNDKAYNGREGVGLDESTRKYWERIAEFVGCEIGYSTWREGWASCQGSEARIRGEDQEGNLDLYCVEGDRIAC
jgi:hypothetical protein